MRAATLAPARSDAPAVTVSPSTSRTGTKLSSSPSAVRRSTSSRSPSCTRYCLPPVLMTAYTEASGLLTTADHRTGRPDLPPTQPEAGVGSASEQPAAERQGLGPEG